MSAAALLQVLGLWMWLNVLGAALVLFEQGVQYRFWFLFVSAAASWASLHLFTRYFAKPPH